MVDFKVTIPNSVDRVFSWESKVDHELNKCRIRIYWITWDKAIIIATDLTNIPERKIAKVTKEIISFINQSYNLTPSKMMLIEHYQINDLPEQDTYLQVLLTNQEVIKYEIDQRRLKELISKPL
jgi:hypothetical protein